MKPQLRLFWLIVLLNFVSGCSGYHTACHSLSEVEAKGGEEFGRNCELEPGDKVRINLVDQESAEGVIQSVSPLEIVLEAKDNDLPHRSFTVDQIQSIEKKQMGSILATTFGLVVIGGILVGIGIGISNLDSAFSSWGQ